ncbi:unnamed protein product [Hermetia illucens]|uniref:DNA repair and recombination protein RAD54-like n=1 Tax=Hermetia illucens TaxID=343691 RepID=A0A7R8UIV2_HERIL|nr:DNA repair and recombination protein RAD54B-like [Hermetia illucens]CAD7080827.1 unnamed protein product [Hermetia illucens]
MRKSLAPSLKNKSFSNISHTSFVPSPSNNPSRISPKILQEAPKENVPNNIHEAGKLYFSVVWSKRTTKKHKTWEGDGTLIGSNGRFVLKDISGNVLGSANSIKPEELYDGNRLIIGSKEIEIQERLSAAPVVQPPAPATSEEKPVIGEKSKKRKSCNVFTPSLHIAKMRLPPGSSSSAISDVADLIFPTPNYSHQWKYNEAKRPVSEVKVTHSLLKSLRPHQREGVIYLYECIQGFRNVDNFGAILADDMGLGKTLQCLTVCHTLLKTGPYGNEPVLRRILIVAPSSLTHHWNEEITKWLSCERLFSYVVDSKNKLKQYPNTSHIPFVITSYEMLLKNINDFQKIKFDLLICDEGHRLKNNEIKVSVCLRQLNVPRRIILSGTPIQNDLQEFYSLVDFVNPGVLGDYQEYKQKYETPIVQSQAPDASEEIKAMGKERAEELSRITNQFVLRRTQNINKEYLPKKTEYIVFVRPTELQQFMLEKALEWYNSKDGSIGSECTALQVITLLKKICNHPSLIRTTSQQENTFVQYLLSLLPDWSEMGPFDSAKLELVQNFLQETILECKERVVLVSNHTKSLDMLADLCSHCNYSYLRLDGSTATLDRNSFVEKFNQPKSEFSVFLLSAKAGGVGLNLSGASRLVLFDNDWNPAVDLQAMSRIWRDGQKRDVKIYRLITAGTIEEKIFQRQIAKTSLSGCVMDQRNKLDTMKLSDEELKDLFTVQDDFSECSTHSSLNCDCDGKGQNVAKPIPEETKNPFDVSLSEKDLHENMLQVNELMNWKHFNNPLDNDLLKEACLSKSSDDIIFIFSNTTEITK